MKHKRLTIKVDPHTYGGSPASEKLSAILNENYPNLVTKVGAYYHKFTEHLSNCVYASHYFPNGGMRIMMELYKRNKFEAIKKSGMPEVIISHLLNVMSFSYKINLRAADELMKSANNIRNHK